MDQCEYATDVMFTSREDLEEETECLFGAVFNGGNHINGFTNASIRKAIFQNASDDDKRIRNKTTRILAKLKVFGLISKVPGSFRYKITAKGVRLITATLSIKNSDAECYEISINTTLE